MLTDAFIFRPLVVSNMIATVGTDKASEGGRSYDVEEMVKHPQYDHNRINNDIAVIKLKEKLQFSDNVQMIKLADPGIVIKDGAAFRIFGFGDTVRDSSAHFSIASSSSAGQMLLKKIANDAGSSE